MVYLNNFISIEACEKLPISAQIFPSILESITHSSVIVRSANGTCNLGVKLGKVGHLKLKDILSSRKMLWSQCRGLQSRASHILRLYWSLSEARITLA